MILLGLRGVGKTVLLNAMRQAAEGEGILCVPIEAPEGQSLPAMLVPALRTAMLKLDRGQAAMTLAKRGVAFGCDLTAWSCNAVVDMVNTR